jgi:hypothetical protein
MSRFDEFIDFGTREVQELSIQWLNLQRTAKHIKCENINKIPLNQCIEKIIDVYNQQKNGNNKSSHQLSYSLDKEQYIDSYCLRTYSCVDEKVTNLSKDLQWNPKKKRNSYFILFFYKTEPTPHIIAVTSGKAYLAIKFCVDCDFPMRVAQKVGNPERIVKVERRNLMGANAKEVLTKPTEWEFNKTISLYYLVEAFKCEIKKGSSLSQLLDNKIS